MPRASWLALWDAVDKNLEVGDIFDDSIDELVRCLLEEFDSWTNQETSQKIPLWQAIWVYLTTNIELDLIGQVQDVRAAQLWGPGLASLWSEMHNVAISPSELSADVVKPGLRMVCIWKGTRGEEASLAIQQFLRNAAEAEKNGVQSLADAGTVSDGILSAVTPAEALLEEHDDSEDSGGDDDEADEAEEAFAKECEEEDSHDEENETRAVTASAESSKEDKDREPDEEDEEEQDDAREDSKDVEEEDGDGDDGDGDDEDDIMDYLAKDVEEDEDDEDVIQEDPAQDAEDEDEEQEEGKGREEAGQTAIDTAKDDPRDLEPSEGVACFHCWKNNLVCVYVPKRSKRGRNRVACQNCRDAKIKCVAQSSGMDGSKQPPFLLRSSSTDTVQVPQTAPRTRTVGNGKGRSSQRISPEGPPLKRRRVASDEEFSNSLPVGTVPSSSKRRATMGEAGKNKDVQLPGQPAKLYVRGKGTKSKWPKGAQFFSDPHMKYVCVPESIDVDMAIRRNISCIRILVKQNAYLLKAKESKVPFPQVLSLPATVPEEDEGDISWDEITPL